MLLLLLCLWLLLLSLLPLLLLLLLLLLLKLLVGCLLHRTTSFFIVREDFSNGFRAGCSEFWLWVAQRGAVIQI